MDGKYLNTHKIYIDLLNKWIEDFKVQLKSKNEFFFDDYHIDEIDSIFEEKSYWLTGAFELFDLFNNHLMNSDFNIALCIFLNRTKLKNNIPKSINKKEFNRIMTPPSLYLFKRGNIIMERPTECKVDNLSIKYKCNVYFGESQELPPEQQYYYRYLYFVIENKFSI